jgi:hypothetical protein
LTSTAGVRFVASSSGRLNNWKTVIAAIESTIKIDANVILAIKKRPRAGVGCRDFNVFSRRKLT